MKKLFRCFFISVIVLSFILSSVNAYAKTESIFDDYHYDETYIESTLNGYRYIFPDGYYWNLGGVSTCPCSNGTDIDKCNFYKNGLVSSIFTNWSATQCQGFATMISDMLFGSDAPISSYRDYEKIRVGDVIRIEEAEHSVVVLTKNDDYITVAECNSDFRDCLINWDRKITKAYLERNTIYCLTRYPDENSDGTAATGSTAWKCPIYSDANDYSSIVGYTITWPSLCIINSSNSDWYYISSPNGIKGYIRKNNVNISLSKIIYDPLNSKAS